MTNKHIKSTTERCTTTDTVTTEELISDGDRRIRNWISMDSKKEQLLKKSVTSSSAALAGRPIWRKAVKRLRTQEPEFGHDNEIYEKIRERVLQERAVTNAIDALQERWRMIMFMYDDCVELNEKRRERKLRKLCIQRQFERILVVFTFMLLCLPILLVFVLLSR